MTVPYNDASCRQDDDYYGASLSELIARMPDYRLIGCGLSGVNAYFVLSDLAAAFPQYAAKDLFQPSRNHLQLYTAGARASFDQCGSTSANLRSKLRGSRAVDERCTACYPLAMLQARTDLRRRLRRFPAAGGSDV
jgi:hypothetical protein